MIASRQQRARILGPDGQPMNRLAYDATVDKHRRQPPPSSTKDEDLILKPADRRKLVAQSRDIHRNFTIAGWMIRKHLDYTSTFAFQARTGMPEVDEQMEGLIRWWSRPANCDVANRHTLQRMTRLWEERRTIDGDVFVLKLSDGRVQSIEGDRIRTPDSGLPDGVKKSDFTHGVQVRKGGAPKAYVVCKRDKAGKIVFERILRSGFVVHHGYFDRFDQVRGISPMAAAVNTLRDTYEGFDYALAKAKVSQLFALAFYRQEYDGTGETLTRETTVESDGSGDGDLEDTAQQRYDVDFGRGPIKLELADGDRAEFLEAKSPSSEFQAFCQTMIGAALKGLDIPYSFYDESFTNYSGSRQAMLQYEQSADVKRSDVRVVLNNLTAWRLRLWIEDGALVLPAGMGISDLHWEWIARGIPWIDPLKEVNADVTAIKEGLASTVEVVKRRGRDAYEVADEEAEYRQYRREKGLPVDSASQQSLQIVEINANG